MPQYHVLVLVRLQSYRLHVHIKLTCIDTSTVWVHVLSVVRVRAGELFYGQQFIYNWEGTTYDGPSPT